MKLPNIHSQRKVMILAFGLILTIFSLSWLIGGGRTNAQSDNIRQPTIVQAATGTGFTYQGKLNQDSASADGTFSFQFVLYDSLTGGAQIGSAQTKSILVNDGLFTTILNDGGEFGTSAFNGEARYLEIKVSSDGGSSYTTLTPRQSLTAAPYAHSLRPGAVISSTVNNSAILNLSNDGTNGVGLFVEQATNEGVTVGSANNGVYVASATTHGFVVGSAANGVYVQSASQDGVHVESATGDGLEVESATNGVNVVSADTGLWVQSATNEGLNVASANNGVYVASATTHGFVVGSAANGVYVQSASEDGIHVESATGDGVEVTSAVDGVHIVSASGAGESSDGLQVDSATGAGVRVEAANTGLYVESASNIGVTVGSALNGMYVISATNWDAYFTGDIRVGSTCTNCLIATFVVNTGDSALQPGDVVALQGTRTGESVGQPLLMEVGSAQAGAPVVGVVYGRGELTSMEGIDGQQTAQLAPREGAAQPGDYVHIVIYGPMQVKASAFGSTIQTGDKLAIGDSGAARSLQTRVLDGISITENASTIGMALEGLETNKEGLIWVLVNPQ